MPASKRNKVVSQTKVNKKTKDFKIELVNKIQKAVETYKFCFVFYHKNMTTNPFREIQEQWKTSKFFLGKNKVCQVALGKDEESTFQPNTYMLSEYLKGDCGLLFTNDKIDDVKQYFDNYESEDYARAGDIAPKTIILNNGTDLFHHFSHSMETYFRGLGLSTQLKEGLIELTADFVLSQQGQPLNAQQCKILRQLEIKMSKFEIQLVAYWKSKTQSFFKIKA